MSDSQGFPPFWSQRRGGVVRVYGEIDMATCDLFAAVVSAVVEEADARESRDGAHLDLAGLEFIGVAGARVLVVAAMARLRGLELSVYHPPVMLARIIEICWGKVPGLRIEQNRNVHTPAVIVA